VTQPIMELEFRGYRFYFAQTPSTQSLINETFGDNYKVLAAVDGGLKFNDGDVMLDLGACEGVFSIMMAKLFPGLRVIALEPVPRTFNYLLKNIELNGVRIEAKNIGVGTRGKRELVVSRDHSGGSSGVCTFVPSDHLSVTVDLMPLEDVFEEFKIDRVKLLKIDIEGMEYEVLYNAEDILPRVDLFTGEFHMNNKLDFDGRRMDGLANWIANRTKLLCIQPCRMAE